jgi:hypothetical protein
VIRLTGTSAVFRPLSLFFLSWAVKGRWWLRRIMGEKLSRTFRNPKIFPVEARKFSRIDRSPPNAQGMRCTRSYSIDIGKQASAPVACSCYPKPACKHGTLIRSLVRLGMFCSLTLTWQSLLARHAERSELIHYALTQKFSSPVMGIRYECNEQ